jgi:hypothetical protein
MLERTDAITNEVLEKNYVRSSIPHCNLLLLLVSKKICATETLITGDVDVTRLLYSAGNLRNP